tara:strand:- start:54 stop:1004 length:951 start_codon:yes stop_codon:yes gene_type:complete
MNILSFSIRHCLDAFRDTFKTIKYFNLSEINSSLIYFKLLVIKLIFSVHSIRNLIKVKKKKFEHKTNLMNQEVNLDEELYLIDKRGYSNTFLLDEKSIQLIKNEIYKSSDFDLKKIHNDQKDLLKKNDESEKDYFKRLSKNGISRLTGTIDLNKNSKLTELINSKPVIDLVSAYLNTNKISINASFFISTPKEIEENEKYLNAQYFHWDNDFTKFLKLYFYLTDVSEGCGPHIYIPYTHKNKHFEHKLPRLYSDSNIDKHYLKKEVFFGKKGTFFFVDGFGIHKGETPKQKPRLMMNIHFGRGKILYSKNDLFIKT